MKRPPDQDARARRTAADDHQLLASDGPAEQAQLADREHEDDQGQDEGERRAVAEVEVREGLPVHVGEQHLRLVERAAFRHQVDRDEDVEAADDEHHRHEGDDWPDRGQRDGAEARPAPWRRRRLPLRCSSTRNALQRGEEDHHRPADPLPDAEDAEREHRRPARAEPVDVVPDQMEVVVEDPVDQAAVGDEQVPEEQRDDDPARDDRQVVDASETGHAPACARRAAQRPRGRARSGAGTVTAM